MGQFTFTIIKPDAFNYQSQISSRIRSEGFTIIGVRAIYLSQEKAFQFYKIHKDKDFFPSLIEYMTSGPIFVYALEKNNAVEDFRKLIGDTDPKLAKPGTIRKIYGTSISSNAIHGADSDENAKREILFFFPELVNKFE